MWPSSFHANTGAQTVNAIRKTGAAKRMREQMLPNVTSASFPARTRFGRRLEIEPRADLQLAGAEDAARGDRSALEVRERYQTSVGVSCTTSRTRNWLRVALRG